MGLRRGPLRRMYDIAPVTRSNAIRMRTRIAFQSTQKDKHPNLTHECRVLILQRPPRHRPLPNQTHPPHHYPPTTDQQYHPDSSTPASQDREPNPA